MEKGYRRIFCHISRANGPLLQQHVRSYECRRYWSTNIYKRGVSYQRIRTPGGNRKHPEPVNPPLKKAPKNYRPQNPRIINPDPTPNPNSNPLRNRVIPIFFGSIALLCFSGGLSYYYIVFTKDDDLPRKTTPALQEDVSNIYDKIATTFDKTVDSSESMMGISSLRQKLASEAVGDVLEVSIGTGRNLEFYSWDFKGYQGVGKVDARGDIKKGKVRSFTAVDKSGEMLEIAHEKFGKMFPGILGVRWVIADAAEKGVIPGPPKSANERSGNLDKKYDTVVQTMGLCSVSDPVALLRNLGECVKEDEGRILLLEHGRGKYKWLNKFLDKSAEGHAKSFGCWWNRDIRSIVEESGLEVVNIETPKWWHGGTTYWIELKKPRATTESAIQKRENVMPSLAAVGAKKEEKPLPSTAEPKKGWWPW
ncbi:hypothetical protein WAI453_002850 [Rhynchosporium graminicola]|uniref:Related to OMS1 Mitochondrial membrane methyltransferase-like protein compensate for oxa1 mutations n=1 Tax=Rhynchosporium graminicola TaxID=2792576 RepID=A0A1E1JVY0_9HELO|nr:related to OMS1 Mitochondrial membrane methyltransferase-like protein compensate for oxa1 mutations [Rhynchosporium commune]